MIYVVLVNNELMPTAYSTLKAICKAYGLGYSSASHGKRLFMKDSVIHELKELSLNKVRRKGKVKGY